MKAPGTKRVAFQLKADTGSKVFVAGTFNNWDAGKNKLTEKNGSFSTALYLPAGKHEYKFVVNGNWIADANCPNWVPDGHGGLNSVIEV